MPLTFETSSSQIQAVGSSLELKKQFGRCC